MLRTSGALARHFRVGRHTGTPALAGRAGNFRRGCAEGESREQSINLCYNTKDSVALLKLMDEAASSGRFDDAADFRDQLSALEAGASLASGANLISGTWFGAAVPADDLKHEVATNPIQWSLTLRTRSEGDSELSPTAFGSGFFDDSGDIAGEPVLFYILRGSWDPPSPASAGSSSSSATPPAGPLKPLGRVHLTKQYEHAKVPNALVIIYEGELAYEPSTSSFIISGAWTNALEGTYGTFSCRREPDRVSDLI
mmetsp:Transcript_4933/g.17141  ORF Transcript_4933/g.17141 Transcript_4933/m.17141 type:complete len:255 (+) Transcript_4933:50-814(+)